MKEATKYKMCLNKRLYITLDEAKRVLVQRQKETIDELRIYKCPICKGYHLTSKEKRVQECKINLSLYMRGKYRMEIKGKVHCFFEQSGTFKNEFKKLGYEAYDYDIQNNFKETDFVIDLFKEIEEAYKGNKSVFDDITEDDLIIAFFPCIYFETIQQLNFALAKNDFRNKPKTFQINYAIDRLDKRTEFHKLLYKLVYVCENKKMRLIIENPATAPNYLITGQNFPTPTIIDKNRMKRGDYFKKPTAYWFFNCNATYGESFQDDKEQKIIDKCKCSPQAGLCSEERSMISPDYARNFICDFILGLKQDCLLQQRLF